MLSSVFWLSVGSFIVVIWSFGRPSEAIAISGVVVVLSVIFLDQAQVKIPPWILPVTLNSVLIKNMLRKDNRSIEIESHGLERHHFGRLGAGSPETRL
jgi:hypothetical protein